MNTGRIFVILRKNPDTLTQEKKNTDTYKQTNKQKIIRTHTQD